jgi:hypothetical protein
MLTGHTITTILSTIVLALTPSDRWSAARELKSGSTVPPWLIWSVGIALALLAVSFIAASYKQKSKKSRTDQ